MAAKVTIYPPEELLAKIKAEAERDQRSLNFVALRALSVYYAKEAT